MRREQGNVPASMWSASVRLLSATLTLRRPLTCDELERHRLALIAFFAHLGGSCVMRQLQPIELGLLASVWTASKADGGGRVSQ